MIDIYLKCDWCFSEFKRDTRLYCHRNYIGKYFLICKSCRNCRDADGLIPVEGNEWREQIREYYKMFMLKTLRSFEDLSIEDMKKLFDESLNDFVIKDIIE